MKKIAIVLAISVLGASVAWACPECHHHCHHHDYYRSDFSDAVALIALLAIGAGIAEQLQTTQQPAATVERVALPQPSPQQVKTIQYPAAPVYTTPASTAISRPRFIEPIRPIPPVKTPTVVIYNF